VDTLLKFKRLAALSTDKALIEKALQASDKLEVKDHQVRRNTPLPSDLKSEQKTVYIKGFPKDGSQDLVESQVKELTAGAGTVLAVRMRRVPNKREIFKGSVFVEFATVEEATAFAAKPIEGKVVHMKYVAPPTHPPPSLYSTN